MSKPSAIAGGARREIHNFPCDFQNDPRHAPTDLAARLFFGLRIPTADEIRRTEHRLTSNLSSSPNLSLKC